MISGCRLEAWLLGGKHGAKHLSAWRALATLVVTGSPFQPIVEEEGGLEGLASATSEALRRATGSDPAREADGEGACLRAENELDGVHISATATLRASHPPMEPAIAVEVRVLDAKSAQGLVAAAERLERALRELLPVARLDRRTREYTKRDIRLGLERAPDEGHPLFGLGAHAVASLRALEGLPPAAAPDDAAGGALDAASHDSGAGEAGGGHFGGPDDAGGGHF